MRVTSQIVSHNLKKNIERQMRDIAQNQLDISSGKKLSTLSENPSDLGKAMALKTSLDKQEQYKSNIDNAIGWMNQTETALADSAELVLSARDLVLEVGNLGVGETDMKAMSAEVGVIIEQLTANTNTVLGRSYIFAGIQTDNKFVDNNPENGYLIEGTDPQLYYHGEATGKIRKEIATGITMQVNVSGEVFVKGENNIFKNLTDLKSALESGDKDKVSELLDKLDQNHDSLVQERTAVGGKIKHLENMQEQMDNQSLNMQTLLENLQGVDTAETTIQLAENKMAYEASLAISAKILQTNILDYLR
ncbi:flagellar hook-associated protein 3 [Desulfofarcimen acetoxidans DSM 771]|uniref:Flagellar hook-associated protein 3 n=1 Tax=Desulfofarcimen acetoxidans (strain ATCC 49208 / DSM 771 / KCTC 5769 / VKM B-1644 / 5575) TaxID=485916 RepID=C8W1E1_DESAS|nr:flagellin [Desulfofarcimen acetoxidans]ACV61586.1 flagellar hook-associated protein 3 [Desulfofarcimen acetoxidans DSM 771]